MSDARPDDIHIGLDLDGVLIDHAAAKVAIARSLGYTVRPEQTNPDILRNRMKPKDYVRLQDTLNEDPVASLQSPLMDGARDLLAALTQKRMMFTLVSRRRNPEWARKILEHHGLRPLYLSDENTYFVSRPEEKNHVALRKGITHYLDDQIKVLKYLEDVPNKFLFDPHGIWAPTHWFGVVRSLPEFLHKVTS